MTEQRLLWSGFAVLLLSLVGASPSAAFDELGPKIKLSQGLPTAEQQAAGGVSTLDSGFGDVLGSLDDQADDLADLSDAMDEVLQPSSAPASRAWVAPRVYYRSYHDEDSDRASPLLREGTEFSFVNPSSRTVEVSCSFFDSNGRWHLDRASTRTLEPGAQGACGAGSPRWNDSFYGWGLIISDGPILPDASEDMRISDDRASAVKLYPIDCAKAVGLDFVCQFVGP